MDRMVASSIPYNSSLCADRAHACAGDSYVSSAIDGAMPTTQNVLAIASPHELHGDSWPSSSTGTSSFCCNQQYSITAVTTSAGSIAERYAYSAYGQPTILDPSGATLQNSNFSIRTSYTGREWDATLGLDHFRARWMSPSAGRFLTRDPIGYKGSEWS
jgi:RHS repeat-associated protein